MSAFSDIPPGWLTIVEFIREEEFDVTVRHGEAFVRFTCPATTSRRDLVAIAKHHKKRLISEARTAMKVADKLMFTRPDR